MTMQKAQDKKTNGKEKMKFKNEKGLCKLQRKRPAFFFPFSHSLICCCFSRLFFP
jgi:hypothetical protein